jgi:phage/conjugal plasmid C-4 type zinc finger TraR family protein
MDEIDRAQVAQERDTQIAILEHRRKYKQVVSTGFCEECGVVIPLARLQAINATTCIDCAVIIEQESKRWR